MPFKTSSKSVLTTLKWAYVDIPAMGNMDERCIFRESFQIDTETPGKHNLYKGAKNRLVVILTKTMAPK